LEEKVLGIGARREMRRLKALEDENGKLKKLVADLSFDKAMLQDVLRQKLSGLTCPQAQVGG
jgi:hypothetical protein